MRSTAVILLAVSLSACSTAVEALRGPQLAPIGYPSALVPVSQPVLVPVDPGPSRPSALAAGANSLWRAGARTFFGDQRAKTVGDILTVQIDIDDSAQVQTTTSRTRSNEANAGVGNLFGLESSLGRVLPSAYDPTKAIGLTGDYKSDGTGSINRSEKVSLTIAAVVTGLLPNGNLIIQGRQEVRTNREIRELTVAGIVRPEDVTAANTIKHTQIAEARISYGGRGDVSRTQAPPAAQALVEKFSPF